MSDTFLASLRPALEVSVANALKRKAISNRGSFAPFRVPATKRPARLAPTWARLVWD